MAAGSSSTSSPSGPREGLAAGVDVFIAIRTDADDYRKEEARMRDGAVRRVAGPPGTAEGSGGDSRDRIGSEDLAKT